MKIAVLGGGFAGISAAYYISKKGHSVTLFEKESILGGLAAGFKQDNWDWYLEKAVHHWFSNDKDILSFVKDTGLKKVIFKSPLSASLYQDVINNYRIIPLDNPQSLFKFPYLNLLQKLKVAFVLVFLKTTPFLPIFEKISAEKFLKKTMGKRAWKVLWKELFRKKFGKYAGNIVASFIWARINKRTKKLAYPYGGFQKLVYLSEKKLKQQGVEIRKEESVENIHMKGSKFFIQVNGKKDNYDAVISTLPTPVFTKIANRVFPLSYIKRLKKIKYLHAISLVIELKMSFFEKEYWVNIIDPKTPIMGIFEHTNFIDKKYYGGNNLLYSGNYVGFDDPLVKMTDKEIFNWYFTYLKRINPKLKKNHVINYFVFKGPFAQPIFDKDFIKNKPDFITPVKNFYIANLDMTYPYDRGTNYAVKLGKEVAKLI
ncbi:MAG: FAD-dependent oxidoreductase [Patescibacteria group bacterium]